MFTAFSATVGEWSGPVAAIVKLASVRPSRLVSPAVWRSAGATGAAFTVSVAALLVAVPAVLVTTTPVPRLSDSRSFRVGSD